MTMKLFRLFSPCIFGHGHTLRTRDEEGHLSLECEDCGGTTRLFDQPMIKGPKHHPQRVEGVPMIRAKRVQTLDRAYPRSA